MGGLCVDGLGVKDVTSARAGVRGGRSRAGGKPLGSSSRTVVLVGELAVSAVCPDSVVLAAVFWLMSLGLEGAAETALVAML